MLDRLGFVSELNDVNLFMMMEGLVFAPKPDGRLAGIRRGLVPAQCQEPSTRTHERKLSHPDFYQTFRRFATDTMGENTPVKERGSKELIRRSSDTLEKTMRAFRFLFFNT